MAVVLAVLVMHPEMVLLALTRYLTKSHLLVVVWEPVIKAVLPEQAVLVDQAVEVVGKQAGLVVLQHPVKALLAAVGLQAALTMAAAVEVVLVLLAQMVLALVEVMVATALHLQLAEHP